MAAMLGEMADNGTLPPPHVCPPHTATPEDAAYVVAYALQLGFAATSFAGNLIIMFALPSVAAGGDRVVSVYLRSLAVFDWLFAVTLSLFLHRNVYAILGWRVNYELIGWIGVACTPLTYIFSCLGYWTVAALNVDRYYALCRPDVAARWRTAANARRVVGGIVAACLVYHVPACVEQWNYQIFIDDCTAVYSYDFSKWMGSNPVYAIVYGAVCAVFAYYLLPLSVILFCGWRVRSAMRSFAQRRRILSKRETEARTVTRIVVAMTVVFVLCVWSDVVGKAMWRFDHAHVIAPDFTVASQTLLLFNSTANFVVYAMLNKNFRRRLRLLLCRSRSRNPVNTVSSIEDTHTRRTAGEAAHDEADVARQPPDFVRRGEPSRAPSARQADRI